MTNLNLYNFPSIKNDQLFEDFVLDLFNDINNTKSFEKYGRSGQGQKGIDIISNELKIVIQCKLRDGESNQKKIVQNLKKSLNDDFDAFLIFNASHNIKYKTFIFASNWKNDTELTDECIRLSNSSNLIVEYWSWERLQAQISENIIKKYYPYLSEINQPFISKKYFFSFENSIDKTKEIDEQLYEYLSLLFKDIQVLPDYLFVNNYPFNSNEEMSYCHNFTLFFSNQNLIPFFDSITIQDNTITNKFSSQKKEKITTSIIEILNRNNILNVENRQTGFKKEIFINQNKIYTKIDELEQFSFKVSLGIKQEKHSDSFDELSFLGYYNYKLGDYFSSLEYFFRAKEIAKSQESDIKVILCNENIYNLGRLVEFYFHKKLGASELVKKSRNVKEEAVNLKDYNKEIYSVISDYTFLKDSKIKIYNVSKKIVDTYNSYLKGGYSNNNYYQELLYRFDKIQTFLHKNFIVYEHFLDYNEIIEAFVEGIFATLNIKNNYDLNSFDDYLLSHLILFSETDQLNRIYNRYNINKFDYNRTSFDGYDFFSIFNNYVDDFGEKLDKSLESYDTETKNIFVEKHVKYLKNLLFFCGVINFNEIELKVITKKVFGLLETILKNNKLKYLINNKYFNLFFLRQRKNIEIIDLKKFLAISLSNKEIFSSELTYIMADYLQVKKVKFDSKEFKDFVINFNLKNIINHNTSDVLDTNNYGLFLKKLYTSKQLKVIKNIIYERLDANYSANIFYLSVIYDFIKIDEKNYLISFVNGCKNYYPIQNLNFQFKNYLIDDLINMYLKSNKDFKDNFINDFKKIDTYYDWIFDLENFDYKDFNTNWLDKYNTIHYYNYFRKSKKLKSYLKELIDLNYDHKLFLKYREIYFVG
ncbi:hypothetical protein M0M57_08875 [Flavobacterium azooxidireducens]|uniref:Restriction endonuclease type IV Mrr domain-containing protein n=1 Tax=Flavobacterium azooxidireducens TaxID=1871076 RepID=A0ABY4KBS4_9FLAO|nr:hypothetical protein [Flavobacterium azooxidireducens]UPQ77745.1 hypothetical protein M0M57_08875 [Flavobacterium azooxidireducens]